jgi:hypothetical protein
MPDNLITSAIKIQSAYRGHRIRQLLVHNTRRQFEQIAVEVDDDLNEVIWRDTSHLIYPTWESYSENDEIDFVRSDFMGSSNNGNRQTMEPRNSCNGSADDQELLEKLMSDLAWAQRAVIYRCLNLKSRVSPIGAPNREERRYPSFS